MAKGTLLSAGLTYAFSAVGTGWDCYKGESEEFNKVWDRCDQNLKGKEGMQYVNAKLDNAADITGTFFGEAWKSAPPVKEVAVKSVAGTIGASIGGFVGSIGGPLGSFVGGFVGGWVGGWLAG